MSAKNDVNAYLDQKELVSFVQESLDNTYYTDDMPVICAHDEHYLFTYGTLKSGFCRHRVLSDSRVLGAGYTLDDDFLMYRTQDTKFGFPIAKRTSFSSLNGHIQGEVYLVPTQKIIELDFIESNGVMYMREELPIVITTADTKKRALVHAWTYIGLPTYWDSKIGQKIKICEQLRANADDKFKYYTFQRRWDSSYKKAA